MTDDRNERFLALLKPIQTDCERWAYRLAGNSTDAQDILQQAILAGLVHFSQLREQARFKQWMFRIIRTTFEMWLRSGKRLPEPMAPEDLAAVGGSVGEQGQSERSRAVQELLKQLSPEQALALWLFEVEGFSGREISQILGKSEGAVRVLILRARERLKELLRKAGITPE
jgi:RNA polymerase sigma-70 factor (ECF subfamily)